MNLTDVEKAVVELSSRHPGLNKEFLRTLLEASGWEAKNIKEAEVILAARLAMLERQSAINLPPVNNKPAQDDFTFYHPDGSEEGDLVIPETAEIKRDDIKPVVTPHIQEPESLPKDIAEEPPLLSPVSANEDSRSEMPEEESLVKEEMSLAVDDTPPLKREPVKWQTQKAVIPENLPLVPFESAPHVWSFSRYKDTFHPEQLSQVKDEDVTPPPTPIVAVQEIVKMVPVPQAAHVHVSPPVPVEVVEIDFEKTPITKGDESLVVLAGLMLLAIMLILGYMYSNGRL